MIVEADGDSRLVGMVASASGRPDCKEQPAGLNDQAK
jgi:hypothetical protein